MLVAIDEGRWLASTRRPISGPIAAQRAVACLECAQLAASFRPPNPFLSGRFAAAAGHSATRFLALTDRLRCWKFPIAGENFWPGTVIPHDVVPALHRGQAVRNLAITAAELDRHRTIETTRRCKRARARKLRGSSRQFGPLHAVGNLEFPARLSEECRCRIGRPGAMVSAATTIAWASMPWWR